MTRRTARYWCGLTAIVYLFASPQESLANGLSTHVWITLDARAKLPDGPIKSLVQNLDYQDMLVSGTMFPDGGYAVGNNYGEIAHWEPFHIAYIDWIRANYPQPWSHEAKQHIAFVLGMTSHGMSDQVFDSLYMERAMVFDADSDWANESMDEATDVAFVTSVGAQTVPARWLPVDVLVEVFRDGAGYDVDIPTLNRGQNLVGLAVAVVGMMAQDPDTVRKYEEKFPWATSHMTDPSISGTPQQISTVVSEYWQRIWERLHEGSPVYEGMLGRIPLSPQTPVATSSSSVNSWLTLVFPAHIKKDSFDDDSFEILDEDGQSYPFTTWLFYRDNSHVLHLQPTEGFPEEKDLIVHLRKEITNSEGYTIRTPWSAAFTTKQPVAEPTPPIESPEETAPTDDACSCQQLDNSFSGRTRDFGLMAILCVLFLRRKRTDIQS